MKPTHSLIFVLILAVLQGVTCDVRADTILRNANIIDLESGATSIARDIFVRGGKIASVEPTSGSRPDGVVIYDATGKFIVPGLWDAHVHIFSSPEEHETAFGMYLLNGVTGIRDMGALLTLDQQKQIAARVEAGETLGPRVILSGAWIDAFPGSWPGMFLADTPAQGRARVDEIADQGWSAAKSYSMLAEDTYLAIAGEAKKQRIALVGHIPESVMLPTAIGAGQNGMEHFGRITKACSTQEAAMIDRVKSALASKDPRSAMIAEMATHNKIVLETWNKRLCDQVLAKMASARMHVTPTLIVSDFYVGKRPAASDIRMRTLPAAVRAAWGKPDFRLDAMTDELKAIAATSIALDWKTFKLAHDAGVPIVAGTDASFANPFIFHGFSLLDELDRYIEIGLSPRQALYTAIVAPPRFFGLPDQDGTIASGRRADLVILDANPLHRLATLRTPRAVVVSGRMLDRAALDKMLEGLQVRAR